MATKKSYALWYYMKGSDPIPLYENPRTIQNARKAAYRHLKTEPIGSSIIILDDYAIGNPEVGTVKKTSSVHKYMVWYPKGGSKRYLRADGTIFDKE